jgi:hypothetical protein
MENKRICVICNKTLVPIGNSRANGKSQNDWLKRDKHKKCYRNYLNNSICLKTIQIY